MFESEGIGWVLAYHGHMCTPSISSRPGLNSLRANPQGILHPWAHSLFSCGTAAFSFIWFPAHGAGLDHVDPQGTLHPSLP